MKTEEEIYIAFRQAQSRSKGRPYRLPRDFEKFLNTRLSEKNREALILVTKYFNTKWRNNDPFRYFECGFELFKNFSYMKFFDTRIMRLYVQRDKHIKRDAQINKQNLADSAIFVKRFIKQNHIASIPRYCMMYRDGRSLPVHHYMQNKIDKFFLVFLIKEGFVKITDDERPLIPYITEHYRDIIESLKNINGFIKDLKERILK